MSGIPARELIQLVTDRFAQAELCYGHGADDAQSEALALVYEVLGEGCGIEEFLRRFVSPDQQRRLSSLVEARIARREPRAYLTGYCWFAGQRFHVDRRVLVPRSPLGELIETRFAPWLDAGEVHSVLDLCTGSGCIGLAIASVLPHVRVDLADISADALAVAAINRAAMGLEDRTALIRSDMFQALRGRRYDLIITNPPYVPRAELAALPAEFNFEPSLGLEAGDDGLAALRRILAEARVHLTDAGMLVGEAGHGRRSLERAFPRLPFLWPDLRRGGEGVFVLGRDDLPGGRPDAGQ